MVHLTRAVYAVHPTLAALPHWGPSFVALLEGSSYRSYCSHTPRAILPAHLSVRQQGSNYRRSRCFHIHIIHMKHYVFTLSPRRRDDQLPDPLWAYSWCRRAVPTLCPRQHCWGKNTKRRRYRQANLWPTPNKNKGLEWWFKAHTPPL